MNWQEFEDGVLAFYSELLADHPNSRIRKNVVEDGDFGKRQYDIMIETDIADFCARTAIECKFLRRKLTLEHLDAFVSKLADSRADKGIIVSSSGFTNQALKKARANRIEAYTLQEARRANIDASLHFPFLLRYIQPENLKAYVELPPSIDPRQLDYDNLGMIPNFVYDSLNLANPHDVIFKSSICLSVKEVFHDFELYINDKNQSPVKISDIKVLGRITGPVYFGFAHKLPGSFIKIDNLQPNAEIHCTIDDIHSLTSHFQKLDSLDNAELERFTGAMLITGHPPYVDFRARVYFGKPPTKSDD